MLKKILSNKPINFYNYVFLFSFLNLILYHLPFYKFIFSHINNHSFNGILLIASVSITSIILNALFFYIILYLFHKFGKILLAILFIINAIAFYFINTYGIIIDESMIGNVFNTKYEEASSFWSFGLLLYILFLGILPGLLLFKMQFSRIKIKKFLKDVIIGLVFILVIIFINSSNWLWIDKNSKTLGGLVMPWSYIVNINRYFIHKSQENKEQIQLPDAQIKDHQKSVVVLVIGESARRNNFSLYGYPKNTNPLLSKISNLHHYDAEACATYTTAGVKCILEHKPTGKLYEILPNYLYRNGVDVVWRTTNWGEPTVKIKKYLKRQDLQKICDGEDCKYDGILLAGLKKQILNSNKDKILIVLHTSTSHGPSYYKKYPKRFEKFSPVCKSVELAQCSREELINAYDNTIVYTDYILASLIKQLKELKGYHAAMIFVSDHGESLGENNLYMHGIPKSIAPEEQYEIPFIAWASDDSKSFRNIHKTINQHYVFHSILDFLGIDSPIFNKKLSIFKN